MGRYKNLMMKVLPKGLINQDRLPTIGIGQFIDDFYWNTSPYKYLSTFRFKNLKNMYQGKRCFIIGNGPSLNQTDLSLLSNEYTFGLNRIYLLFPKMGFQTTFYVSVNPLVLEQCNSEIANLNMIKFISWHSRKHIPFAKDMIYIRDPYKADFVGFSKKPYSRIWEGATVTYVAMQIAYYLGFDQVVLVGIDHKFRTDGKPNTEIVSEGNDQSHFDPNYFGKGFRWNLPDLEFSEASYRIAKLYFERSGKQIIDATVNGNLTVFPKAILNDVLSKREM